MTGHQLWPGCSEALLSVRQADVHTPGTHPLLLPPPRAWSTGLSICFSLCVCLCLRQETSFPRERGSIPRGQRAWPGGSHGP